MATAVLEYVPKGKDDLQPLLVNFTNASLTADRKGKKKQGLEFTYYRWKDTEDSRKSFRRILTAKSDAMEYTGDNFKNFSRSNNPCKYLVGVLDNESGKMKLYDTETFTLQPKILEKSDAVDKEDSSTDLSFMEKSDRLTEAFGSGKQKRLAAARKKNVINMEELNNLVTDAVQGPLMSAALEQESQDTSSPQSSTLPPFNIKAETAADVYKLDDIVSPSEYNAIKFKAKELQDANKELIEQWRKSEKFPEYILQHAAVMPLSEVERAHRSCLLLYLSYLIDMFKMNSHDLNKKGGPFKQYPNAVEKKLLSFFTLENPKKAKTRLIPKRLKDKLLSYLLVLCLIIDEFAMDCTVIAKDLKVNPKRIATHLRILGCTMSFSKSPKKRKADGSPAVIAEKTATLKVPLPPNFPNMGKHF